MIDRALHEGNHENRINESKVGNATLGIVKISSGESASCELTRK